MYHSAYFPKDLGLRNVKIKEFLGVTVFANSHENAHLIQIESLFILFVAPNALFIWLRWNFDELLCARLQRFAMVWRASELPGEGSSGGGGGE